MSSPLPTGTITFLFTDIEGSTELWEKYPHAMKTALAAHDALLREMITTHHGHVIKGRGDGIHAVFVTALDAVQATLAAQRELQKMNAARESKSSNLSLKVRMGLHTGEAELREGDYYGQTLNRAARLMAAGHGGQILLSDITAQMTRDQLPAAVTLLDLGEHQLKGLLHTEHLYQLVAPGLPKDFPPLNSTRPTRHNLPTQLTSFIGRERELADAQQKLAGARLLTVIGPGGIGKTRLALQIAAEQLPNFKDGVWLVELASLTDPHLIVSTIAAVFEVREVPGIPLLQLILDYLRAKELLLVLDNCEHLVEAAAQIADQLLHACAQLKLLASSREALGIDGETVFRLPSLALPEEVRPHEPGEARREDVGNLMDYAATRLFIERATKAEPRFQRTDANAAAIVQICRRLDGIPLAIELAAARVKLFTPEQIADRLADRFKLLTGGSRTALPRQQTLRAAIDWSYQSLNEIEQRAMRRLAVFSGGWSFEAAEAVIGESEALEGLAGLVNKSLVTIEEHAGEARYAFLETIRQYALEKLVEAGEASALRDHHLDYMLQRMQQYPPSLFRLESVETLDQMETEYDNVRAALEWATANQPEKALQLAYAVGGFWTARDYSREATRWCQAILQRTQSLPGVDADRARLYALDGWSYMTLGEHKEGRAAAEQALTLAKKVNDPVTVIRAYSALAFTCIFLGDYPVAREAVRESERLARENNLKLELVFILSTHAQLAYHIERDALKAKRYLDESAQLVAEAGFPWDTSFSASGLARVAALLGDLETARAKFNESIEVGRKVGNQRVVLASRSELAHVLREHGELAEALEIYKDLLPKWKEIGHRPAVAHELECIAYILMRHEDPVRAATLLGAAEALRAAIDTMMTKVEQAEYEKEIATLRTGMEAADFQKHWSEGRALTMDQAIAYALESDSV